MTLNEKTAGSFAGDSAGSFAGSYADGSASATGIRAFSDVVDKACEKLMDKQVKYSIRRIQEMEECLADLEKELDDFLCKKNRET